MRTAILSLALLTLLTPACGPRQQLTGTVEPQRTFTVSEPDAAPRLPPLFRLLVALKDGPEEFAALDVSSDINLTPIRAHVVESNGDVAAVDILGHADGECCPLVSKALGDAASHKDLSEEWLSFGIARLRSGRKADLNELRDILRQYERDPRCAGQLKVVQTTDDRIAAASNAFNETAKRAFVAARDHGRPLLLWHDFEADHPAIVPLQAVRRDRQVEPLEIELHERDFMFPDELSDSLSVGGVGQYIAYLRSRIELLEQARALRPKLDELAAAPEHFTGIDVMGARMNYRAGQLVGSIRASNVRAGRALAAQDDLDDLIRLMIKITGSEADALAAQAGADKTRKQLQDSIAANERALAKLATIPEAVGPTEHTVEWHDVKVAPGPYPEFRQTARMLVALDIDAQLSTLGAKLREAKDIVDHPPSDPYIALVDAALRGWPATFSDVKAENLFDQWLQERQPQLWRTIQARLSERGVNIATADGMMGVLGRSNIVYRIEHHGKKIRIQPHAVLASSFFMVADPQAGLVRYESAVSDQNLAPMEP